MNVGHTLSLSPTTQCPYCGMYHTGMCDRVKKIEYYEWGGIKSVELFDMEKPNVN